MSLGLCGDCGRHVRESDAACPFCGGSTHPIARATRATPRVSRAVLIAGIGAAAVGVACNQSVATFYGAPFVDASGVDGSSEDALAPDALYGGPPYDAGVDAAGDAPDGD